jgi:hypothetical protein
MSVGVVLPTLLAEFATSGLRPRLTLDLRGLAARRFVEPGGAIVLAMAAVLSGEVQGKGLPFVTTAPS